MLGVCFRYVNDRQDAEDVLQEGFIKVFQHLSAFRHEGSLEGWIRRIMVTTALNFLKKYHHLVLRLDESLESGIQDPEQADQGLMLKDTLQTLRRLAPGYRTIVNLYAIEGYSHKEIAEMLGITESTSRSQYARARQWLRARLQPLPVPMTKQCMHDSGSEP